MLHLALLLSLLACQVPQNPRADAQAAKAGSSESPATQTMPVEADPEPAKPDSVVASWDDGQVTYAELEDSVKGLLTRKKSDYLQERYRILKNALDRMIDDALLTAEAKRRGLPDKDALIDAEVNQKVTSVSEAEIQKFYEENKRRFRNRPLDQIREQVEKRALDAKRAEARQALIDSLREKAGLHVDFGPPELPRIEVSVDDDPVRGNPDAPVTIIEFADFQCPYCGRASKTVHDLLEKYGDKLRFVFRDYPLSFHRNAMPSALAANCAGKQGKFWEMYDLLYENQRALDQDSLEKYASQLGLDLAKWKACLQDKSTRDEIMKDFADGQAAGVTGTPAFFINGVMITGARPIGSFTEVIDKELARLESAPTEGAEKN